MAAGEALRDQATGVPCEMKGCLKPLQRGHGGIRAGLCVDDGAGRCAGIRAFAIL